ncbi:MAG: hypothetical protein P8X68_23035 [Desulfobacterales bacterium]
MEHVAYEKDIYMGKISICLHRRDIVESQTSQAYIFYSPDFGILAPKRSKCISPRGDTLIFSFLDGHGHLLQP